MSPLRLAAVLAACLIAVPALAQDAPRYGVFGLELDAGDARAKAGDNFYRYAQGSALDRMQIPADRPRYGAFDTLAALSEQRVRKVLDDAASRPQTTANGRAMGALWRSYMDQKRVDALDIKPLRPLLDQIRAADREKLTALMVRPEGNIGKGVFETSIGRDRKTPDRYAIVLNQGGLGLPDRDYYLSPQFAMQKGAYREHIETLLKMAGWPKPDLAASAVLALETRFAVASWPRRQQRDPMTTWNPMTVGQLATLAPGFPWRAWLDSAGLKGREAVVVAEPGAFTGIASIYANAAIDDLRAWAAFQAVDKAAPYLSKRFTDAEHIFHDKALRGQLEPTPRWRRGVAMAEAQAGEAVGQLYVADYFPPEAKAQMEAMVGELKAALRARIGQLGWMSIATKARARTKLEAFTVKIAYPDEWRDYSGVNFTADDLYGNIVRGRAFDWNRRRARLDQPVDVNEWRMTPQTVNAYYDPSANEMILPAAILQPPLFDPRADPAVNYGAMGAVLGHEMIHGFDDPGRRFDGTGRLADWWTNQDSQRFSVRARRLARQYSSFEPITGARVNGMLTLGENIADLGGLQLALAAYRASLKGQPAPVINGLSGEQRLFLGWAQLWRGKSRDDELRRQLVNDSHSPNAERVNGVVRNIDAWYEAFGVQPGEALYVPVRERVRIW